MPKILVLGGSFAGVMTARNIKSEVPHAEITIIDQKEYFEYTPGILRALVNPSHLPLLHARMADVVASPSLSQQVAGWWPTASAVKALWPPQKMAQPAPAAQGIRFLWGCIQSLDTDAREAIVQPCGGHSGADTPNCLPYDYVVLATGSDYAAPMKPSALEGSQPARVAAVGAVHSRLQALAHGTPQPGHVLVIGGGAVGVEMVGELVAAFPSLRVTLVSSSPRLLAEQTAAVSAAALRWCAQRGVRVLLGVKAHRQDAPSAQQQGTQRSRSKSRKQPTAPTGASASAAAAGTSQQDAARSHVLAATRGGRFALSSGGVLDADMVFTCVGFKPNSTQVAPPNTPLHQSLAPSKQVAVNDQLQALLPSGDASSGRVFGAGDVALHAASGELKLAHTAEMMAHTAAANVAGSVRGSKGHSTFRAVLAAVWGWLLLLLRAAGAGSAAPATGRLHSYPGHMSGFAGWPIPRVMCVSLGPNEAILVMNGMSLTSYPGRVAGAWAKWVIETSKMWATRDLAIGHAIWAFGDAAAVAVSNLLVLPLAQNQPAGMAHRVASAGVAPGTAAPLRLLWSVWVALLSAVAAVLRLLFPGTFTLSQPEGQLDIPAQTTASF